MSDTITQQPLIEVRNVSFSFGKNVVIDNISFDIPRGDYLGIIGPNGAGKTTLLKIILGLVKPAQGTVKFYGKDLSNFTDWEKIGYVPQKATHVDARFPATVYEVVMMSRYAHQNLFHRSSAEDKHLVKQALEHVGMWEYHDRLIGELSGGQQQRVFIARALATKPEIIFLDEPTIGVDEQARDEFYGFLRKLNQERHLTLILISHDVDMVIQQAKHIACVDRKLICHSLPKEFLRNSASGELVRGGVRIFVHKHTH